MSHRYVILVGNVEHGRYRAKNQAERVGLIQARTAHGRDVVMQDTAPKGKPGDSVPITWRLVGAGWHPARYHTIV